MNQEELRKQVIEESINRNYPNSTEEQKNAFRLAEGIPIVTEEDKIKIKLGEIYERIKKLLDEYVDIDEHKKTLIALWIIGTWVHNSFETFPYLFLNAMRGSGKTRLLKLITSLCWDGQLLASLTEAVLFRCNGTLGVDEFESIGSKEKQALRELLNAGYKKGIKIRRMKKVKKRGEEGGMEEGQEAEEFDAYRPIIMANIWGMDEVLGDRCIQLVLEKSGSSIHTKKIENFMSNSTISSIKSDFIQIQCSLCSVVMKKNIITDWNNYINIKYNNTTHNYITTLTTHNYTNIHQDSFFNKVDATNLDGRHLELYFPFFVIANFLNESILTEILEIAKNQVEDKRIDENMESKDVMLFDFISRTYETEEWINVNELTKQFRDFIGDEDNDAEKWLNAKWMGRAIKRLCLVKMKRRLGRGMDVVLNKVKADDKMKMFHRL